MTDQRITLSDRALRNRIAALRLHLSAVRTGNLPADSIGPGSDDRIAQRLDEYLAERARRAERSTGRFVVEPHIGSTWHVRDTTLAPVDSMRGEVPAGIFGPAPIVTVCRDRESAERAAADLNLGDA